MSGFQTASIGVDQFLSVRIALIPDSATPFELFWSSLYWAWWISPQYKLGSVVGIEEISGIRKEKGLLELLHLQGIDDKSTDLGQTFCFQLFYHSRVESRKGRSGVVGSLWEGL